jgi:hypothetical protein
MKTALLVFAVLSCVAVPGPARADSPEFDADAAGRFATLALQCVHQEYPNKIAHVMSSDADVKPPRKLTPAFHGCFDWHSSVHGHWLLARLIRIYPDAPFVADARKALDRSLTPANIAAEVKYLHGADRASFERPYGLAWLLQLAAELREMDDADGKRWAKTIQPLETAVQQQLRMWLPKLSHPVRSGEHSQSAFALGLMIDWSRVAHDHEFEALVFSKIRRFYLADRDCPIEYEPSGEDFLSPCVAEADVVRRIMSPAEYAAWLGGFFPTLGMDGEPFITPAVAADRSDGKLAHLDGLNLSRAWMLEGIAAGLPENDPRRAALHSTSASHAESGLQSVTGEHYAGGHWLGSFATYLVTRRGVTTLHQPHE